MNFTVTQQKLFDLLAERKLVREELFSVMLVLTAEEKAKKMISFLEENENVSQEEIREQAGKIAFGEK